MIRVLQVVTHMNRGGLETMLMNYYRHIDRSEMQFDFLTHRPYDGDYGEEIHDLGGIIYHLPMLNPFSPSYIRALHHFFEEHQEYTIVHVHQDCMSSVILQVAKQHGVPVRIAHSHNTTQDHNLKYLIKMFYKRRIPRYATQLLACGQEAGKWMFGETYPYEIMRNAISASSYQYDVAERDKMRAILDIREDELVLGHVGRFCPQKNHAFLIDIFAEVQKRMPARLLLVGDGELRDQIEEKVKTLSLNDKVIFTGVRTDVASLMQAMDVFVFPSLYEGLPVTMVEAQAAGLPSVISDKVPIECMFTDLVEIVGLEDSVVLWADKILLNQQKERRNTTDDVKEAGFDIEDSARRLQWDYDKLVQGCDTSDYR